MTGNTMAENQLTSTPAGSVPGATSYVRAAYSQVASSTATSVPSARHSQPTAFPGRREATTAPTVAYAGMEAGRSTSHQRISERYSAPSRVEVTAEPFQRRKASERSEEHTSELQ